MFLPYRDLSSMPNHSSMSPRRLIPLLGAAVAVLASAAPAGAVVGGTAVPIAEHPYQVALLDNASAGFNWDALVCGGTIRDATHVITAAHCVYNWHDSGAVASPGQLSVLSGTATLSKSSTDGRVGVRALSFSPAFDPISEDDDAAVLTLAAPLPDDATHRPLRLVTAAEWAAVVPPAPLYVTGWGSTQPRTGTDMSPPPDFAYPTDLQGVSVPLVDDQTCANDYQSVPPPIDGASTVCAGGEPTGGKDACVGDSGGPLVSGASLADYVLVGIVSSGYGCAQAHFPGLYTEVAKPSVRDYVGQDDPVPPPGNTRAPSLSGAAAVGSTLECITGEWTENPSLAVQWVRSLGGADYALTAADAAQEYPVQLTDVGGVISCVVRASSRGGFAYARSQASDVVPTPAPPAQPAARAPTPPTAQQDVNRPFARILTARCVKQTCTITVRVSDAGVTAGIAKVTGSVRSTYRRDRRTRHRARTFTARRTAATRFTVKLTKLPVGTQVFSLLATDKAGHRQLLPTRRTLKTKR